MATGSSGLPIAGVEAQVVGFNEFLKQLGQMNTATQRTGQEMGRSTATAEKGFSSLDAVLMGLASGGITILANAAMNVLGGALDFAVTKTKELASALVDLAVSAAPLPGISQAFGSAIAGTSLSLDQLRNAAAGTVSDFELMRKVNLGLAGTQGELKEAFATAIPGFLEIARAAARATGDDVNFMFDSIVRGVKRNSPLIIDNALITLSAADAYEVYADSVGKSVDDLTDQEQRIAIINRTLQQGAVLVEQYGGSTLTAAENMAIMRAQARNIADTVGLALQPALTTLTSKLAEIVTWFANAIQPGGALRNVLVNLGAAASILADSFVLALNIIIDFANSLGGEVASRISGVASSAFNWGAQIVANLASGIIQAAQTILVQAMNFVSSVLSFWLAPGSPPRVAPQIDKWGTEAMTEYLRGFTEADFGILDKLSGTFERALGKRGLAGVIDELLTAVDMGEVTGDMFDQIATQSGEFGTELALLAQQQIALAEATEAAARANQDFERSQNKVSKLTREFNDLLREGASQDVLDAKMAQIRASEEERDAAADNKAQTEGNVDALEAQAATQQKMVDQLLKLAELQEALVIGGRTGGGAGGVGAIGAGAGGLGDLLGAGGMDIGDDRFDLAGTLQEEIDTAKQTIIGKLQELAEPFKVAFDGIMTNAGEVGIAFDTLSTLVGEAWFQITEAAQIAIAWYNENVAPAITILSELIGTLLVIALQAAADMWSIVLLPILQDVADFAETSIIPLWESIAELNEVILVKALEAATGALELLLLGAQEMKDWMDVNFVPLLKSLAEKILPDITGAFDGIAGAIGGVIGKIRDMTQKIKDLSLPDWLKPGSPPPLEIGLRGIADQMQRISAIAPTAFGIQAMTPVGAVAGAASVSRTANVEINVSTGPITNGMDVANLRAVILNTVGQAMAQTV